MGNGSPKSRSPSYPDGRKTREPHLKTFRDGWRTLRFYLMYSPRWLFLLPWYRAVFCSGLLGYAVAMPGLAFMGMGFDAHTLLFASLAILCRVTSRSFLRSLPSSLPLVKASLLPEDARLQRFLKLANLEKGLLIGAGSLLMGVVLLLAAVNQWRLQSFGPLNYAETMRWVIVTLTMLGFQMLLNSFFFQHPLMRRRHP